MKTIEELIGRPLTEKEIKYYSFVNSQRTKRNENPLTPKYHFSAPEDYMNDPNGLCFWHGRWHLFYQAFPPDSPILWGHAVSEDMIHWTDLPYALEPDGEKACWSGATFAENDRVIAMYHAFPIGNKAAVSSDEFLLDWERKGMIPSHTEKDPYVVFDPCIWKDGEYYYSLSGSSIAVSYSKRRERCEYLFRSKDLTEWEYLHPLVQGGFDALPAEDGACPYFWPIGDKHILIHFSHISGAKYLLGKLDRENMKLIPIRGGCFNNYNISSFCYGGAYAPSAAPLPNGDVAAIVNYSSGFTDDPVKQVVSLPRRYYLFDGDTVGIKPMIDFSENADADAMVGEKELKAGEAVELPELNTNCGELTFEFAPANTTPTLEINLLCSSDGGERTTVRVYRQTGIRDWEKVEQMERDMKQYGFNSTVMIDNANSSSRAGITVRPPEMSGYFNHPDDSVRLKIFIDKSIVEVFVNDVAVTFARVYPKTDSVGVSVKALEKDTRLLHAERYDFGG